VKLTSQVGGIVAQLSDAPLEIARLVEEGERQAKIRIRELSDEARKDLIQAIEACRPVANNSCRPSTFTVARPSPSPCQRLRARALNSAPYA